MDLIEIEKMIAEATVKLEADNARLREELAEEKRLLAEESQQYEDLREEYDKACSELAKEADAKLRLMTQCADQLEQLAAINAAVVQPETKAAGYWRKCHDIAEATNVALRKQIAEMIAAAEGKSNAEVNGGRLADRPSEAV